jgi:hypothetical protein
VDGFFEGECLVKRVKKRDGKFVRGVWIRETVRASFEN